MATLQSYINSPEIKPILRGRYSASGYFVTWANQLLEELQERGFLSTNIKEVGQIVKNGIWINKPSDLLLLEKIYNPEDENQIFRVIEVNSRYKMADISLDASSAVFETVGTFTASGISSIDVDLLNKSADVYKNYLLYITAGNLASTGIILYGNDASGVSSTTLNFSLDLNTALGVLDITAAELIPPQYYVVVKYHSLITQISSVSDEMPIPDDCESRLIPTWLRWCCEREAMEISKETQYWGEEKDKILYSVQAKRSSRLNPAKGRRLVGMERFDGSMRKQHPPYSSCG